MISYSQNSFVGKHYSLVPVGKNFSFQRSVNFIPKISSYMVLYLLSHTLKITYVYHYSYCIYMQHLNENIDMITTEPDLPICDNVPECAVSAIISIIPWHAI